MHQQQRPQANLDLSQDSANFKVSAQTNQVHYGQVVP